MEIVIVVIIVISIIGSGILFYFYQNKQVSNLNKIEENFRQIPDDKIDWNITQHLGWLYKNGKNENFDNMNLYFNQSNARFFALDDNTKINLNVEMVKNGDSIEINNETYVVAFSED